MENQFIKTIKESVKMWYLFLIAGLLFIATGIWTFTSPAESYLALSMVFSISFLVAGLMEMFFSFSNKGDLDGWGWSFAMGVFTTLLGATLISHPAVSMLSLPIYVGFFIMFRSIWAIGISLELKNYGVKDWGSLMIIAVLGLILSFLFIWNPKFAGMTIVFWTAIGFIVSGIFNVFLSLKMKDLHKNWDNISAELKDKIKELQEKFNNELS